MKYNFDNLVNRIGTCSYKWNIKDGEIPMWVADMDFQTAPEIISAIQERANHGVFGYNEIPNEWYEAYSQWWASKHNFCLEKKDLIFSCGVVASMSSIVRKFTTPNENVLICPPVYNIFYNSVINNGARVLESPLVFEDGKYEIDFADFEKKAADPQTSLFILCNPHNPVGKIWDSDTLIKIGEICAKNNVIVVSDEIHCDLCIPGREYIPFASLNEINKNNSITLIAPSKTFNLAGLQSSAVYVPNTYIRHKVNRALNTDEVAEPNSFAVCSSIAAFTQGSEWHLQLREYLFENRLFVKKYIEEYIPQIHLVDGEATYLLWIDLCSLREKVDNPAEFIRSKTGLWLSNGESYGYAGKGFLRMNIACPKSLVEQGMIRLKKAIELLCDY